MMVELKDKTEIVQNSKQIQEKGQKKLLVTSNVFYFIIFFTLLQLVFESFSCT